MYSSTRIFFFKHGLFKRKFKMDPKLKSFKSKPLKAKLTFGWGHLRSFILQFSSWLRFKETVGRGEGLLRRSFHHIFLWYTSSWYPPPSPGLKEILRISLASVHYNFLGVWFNLSKLRLRDQSVVGECTLEDGSLQCLATWKVIQNVNQEES